MNIKYLAKHETKEIIVNSPHEGCSEYWWSRIRYPADLSVEHALQAGVVLGCDFIMHDDLRGEGWPYLALLDVDYEFFKNHKPKANDVHLYDSENLVAYPSDLVLRQENVRSVSIAMPVPNYYCFESLRKALNAKSTLDKPDENVWFICAFAEYKFELKDLLEQRLEKPIKNLLKIKEDQVNYEIQSQIIFDISFGAGQLEDIPFAIIIEASFRSDSLFEGQRITDEKIQELLVKKLAEYPFSKKKSSENPVTLCSILGTEYIYIKDDGIGYFYREYIENWLKTCKAQFEFTQSNQSDDFENKNLDLAVINCLESIEFYLAIYGKALGSALKQDLQRLWSSLPIAPHKLRQAALAGNYDFMWRLELEENDCIEKIKRGISQKSILVRANFNHCEYKIAQITYPSNLSVEAALQAGMMLGADQFYSKNMDCTNHLAILGVSWSFYEESKCKISEKNQIVDLYFSQVHIPLIDAKMFGDNMYTDIVHYSATFGADFVVAEQLYEILKAQQVPSGGLDWEDIGDEIRGQIFGSNCDKVKLSLPEDLDYQVSEFIFGQIIIDVSCGDKMLTSRQAGKNPNFDFFINITITDASEDTDISKIEKIFEAVFKHPAMQVISKCTRVDKSNALVPNSGLSPILINRIERLCDFVGSEFDDIDKNLDILYNLEFSMACYGLYLSPSLRKRLVSSGAYLRRAIPREKRIQEVMKFYN